MNLISIQQLIPFMKIHYGIDGHTIKQINGGADMNAVAYKVDAEGYSYFVKIKSGAKNDLSLSIVRLLHDCGVKEVILPIPTRNGALFQPLEHCRVIVYPFINVPDGFSHSLNQSQWQNLGAVLGRIHQTTVPTLIKQQLRQEQYSATWRNALRTFYNRIEINAADDPIAADFKSYFKQNIKLIHRLVDTAEELAKQIQPDRCDYVLCHSDIHAGNVLVGDSSIYIIDWDEAMLAPKERDLMFIGGGVGNVWNKPDETRWFYEGYGEIGINKNILSYYRHERIVEDMAIYAQDVLSPMENSNASLNHDSSRLESFNYFKSMFAKNDVVEIAFR